MRLHVLLCRIRLPERLPSALSATEYFMEPPAGVGLESVTVSHGLSDSAVAEHPDAPLSGMA